MLTQEEIADIVQYHNEHGVTYKSRLKEIGISEWRFYESKRRYAEVQAGERAVESFSSWCVAIVAVIGNEKYIIFGKMEYIRISNNDTSFSVTMVHRFR